MEKYLQIYVEHSGNYNRIKLKTFARVAASILIIISLGGLLYLHLNRVENQYQFSESSNDLKTDKPLLVLSNGTKVELEKRESKITVLKDQDAIQIIWLTQCLTLNAPVNTRLLFFIITGKFIRFFNLTSGLNCGEYYKLLHLR